VADGCHGHVPAYLFFFLRVSYVTGHWSVTGRSAGQAVVCGLVARRDVLFVGPFGRKVVFFLLFLFVILVVNNVNLENFGGVF